MYTTDYDFNIGLPGGLLLNGSNPYRFFKIHIPSFGDGREASLCLSGNGAISFYYDVYGMKVWIFCREIFTMSDERHKTNIKDIDSALYRMHLSHLNECSFFKSLLNESAPDYSNNLGFVYNKSKNLIYDQSIDHNSYLYLAYGINLIGDAEMPVSTRNNKNISASFSYDKYLRERIVRITDKPENCIITLSDQRVNPEILFISKDSDYVRFAEPEGPFVITITGRNCTPRVYEPTEYEVLHLHDCVIDADRHYIAGDVIIGNNVTVKAGVTLTLNSKGGFRILDNVVCEGNAKLILKNI